MATQGDTFAVANSFVNPALLSNCRGGDCAQKETECDTRSVHKGSVLKRLDAGYLHSTQRISGRFHPASFRVELRSLVATSLGWDPASPAITLVTDEARGILLRRSRAGVDLHRQEAEGRFASGG